MKVAVYTLGCKVNTYESEYIINEFKKSGYTIVPFDEASDIYVINTCTVTNTSDQKSRKMIREAKKKNKDAVVVAIGCFVQVCKDKDGLMGICDIALGNTNKSMIVPIIDKYLKNKEKMYMVGDVFKTSFEDMELSCLNTRTRAIVKIEDGCNNYCSYCIIPYARGNVRSKSKDKILEEVNSLVKNGYKEIVLAGIHTGHYGADLGDYDFSDLLIDLEKIDDLERIRISSIEITELNDKFLDTLKKSKKIVNHLHIPLQSGCDKILKLMNRKYDLKYYEDRINKIRDIRDGIAITTDVIVGFPNESDECFCDTINFVKKIAFAGGHVFPFSSRNGTPAAAMDHQITKQEKHERCKQLISVFDELENDYYKKFVGKVLNVISESFEDGILTGHTGNYLKVSFKGCKELLGKDVNVLITKASDKLLNGKMI